MTKIFTVDAFTESPFRGNPAGICPLDGPRSEAWMQNVASEMNLSETAFLYPEGNGFRLRWFTPKAEVDLCGHATLASAHILWEQGAETPSLAFFTRSGVLTARRRADEIALDFPAVPESETPAPQRLLDALKVTPCYVARKGEADYLVEVASESILRALQPDMALLKEVARGVAVTCRSERPEYDFVSRFFAPRVGIDEDPVTGSAHCCLAPYWKKRLGKESFVAFQASRRGGVVRVRVAGERVELAGRAVTVLRGELLV